MNLEFHSLLGLGTDSKIAIHSFPARRLALKRHCREPAGEFTFCADGKELESIRLFKVEFRRLDALGYFDFTIVDSDQ